ncbi:HAD-like protein [Polychaeton citri CBS 116435]|uniref:HAD-like protein n=1 Tax=Polychaeton citri CBS 116435 TaxID=1314669 RepID=A0A9P4UK54_9PEZI|nr:HAD-like protein [Polychaeton citri CBS 116435]
MDVNGVKSSPPPVRACLFDMDGLLINSEDLISICINEVLTEFDKPPLPWHIKAQPQGRTLEESSKIFHSWAKLPISPEEYQQRLKKLHLRWFPTAKPLAGVEKLLKNLNDAKQVELALATSSNGDKFQLKSNHLGDIFSVFPYERRVLRDDPRILPGRHKPAPDIYLLALKCINDSLSKDSKGQITPQECLVFEDAIQGVEAGRRAGMQVLWCPHPGLLEEIRGGEHSILNGPLFSMGLDGNFSNGINVSWTRLLLTLEDFDYESYGLKAIL